MILSEALREAAMLLANAGLEDPRREARALAAHVLGVSPGSLLDQDRQIDAQVLHILVERRASREPLAYITGRRGFWTLELSVSADTLIPRPDSETLIEAALALFPARANVRRILDLGTGTGCLVLAALAEFPAAFGVGVDLSPGAATLAARNAAAAGLHLRAGFLAGDWADALCGRFDLILCNPPYIPTAEIEALMPEVAVHEPRRALDGGCDGLRAYARLMTDLCDHLAPQGVAILELGVGQGAAVSALARAAGLRVIGIRCDLGGIDRALMLGLPGDASGRAKKPFGSTVVGS